MPSCLTSPEPRRTPEPVPHFCPQLVTAIQLVLLVKPVTRPQASVPVRMVLLASPVTAVPQAFSRAGLLWRPVLVSDPALSQSPQPKQSTTAVCLSPEPFRCPCHPITDYSPTFLRDPRPWTH